METEIKYATERLINSVWTLAYTQVSDNEISILSYGRENKIGYSKETEFPRLGMITTNDRTVIAVRFIPYNPFKCWCDKNEGVEFKVINPKHIFDYGK